MRRRRWTASRKTRQFVFITLPLLRPVIVLCVVLSVIGTMQLFSEPFLITNRGGPGQGDRDARALPLPAGLRRLQFRLRVGHCLHDRRAGNRHLAAQSAAWRGNANEEQGLRRTQTQDRASRRAHAACGDLAVSALDDVRVLDDAGQRHLQPRHRAAAVTAISSTISQSAEADTGFIRATTHLGPGGAWPTRSCRCADLDGRLGACALPVLSARGSCWRPSWAR